MGEEHIHGRQPRSVRVRLGLTSAATNPPVDSSKLANMTRVSSSSERAHRGVKFAPAKGVGAAGSMWTSAKTLIHKRKAGPTGKLIIAIMLTIIATVRLRLDDLMLWNDRDLIIAA